MKSILVTGGSGSFGQEFIKNILNGHRVERVAVYSRGEHLQEEMQSKFKDDRLRYFIGDVRDRDRLEMAMNGVDTVIHAAALKIVPTAEYNPTECIATNVTGAENVVKAALRSGVKRVVALSTDKAVNPINLYGASKLAAEKVFVAANALGAGKTNFNVVRYGNVSGSRGSVLPLFKKLNAEGKPLSITDERMTRFWITLHQSVDLVYGALHLLDWGYSGCVVVPKIPSMRITDLAVAINGSLDGVKINTGIRPGEKLHETLITEDEARFTRYWDEAKIGRFYVIAAQSQANAPRTEAVPESFRYQSDTNDQWLTVEQLRNQL